MLGRNSYTEAELTRGREILRQGLAQLQAHPGEADFEHNYCNNLLLALDRLFVHRVRGMSGKDTNPLTEVELLVDSLLNTAGVLTLSKVIKYRPEAAVLGLAEGDQISLNPMQLQKLGSAFLDEITTRSS